MFGFRNRKKYNAVVDTKLNNEYQIRTQDNQHFPGILTYLKLIDTPYYDGATEDECALQIASLYLSGAIRNSLVEEARAVSTRIGQVGPFGIERGLIRQEVWDKCVALVEKTRREVAEPPIPKP